MTAYLESGGQEKGHHGLCFELFCSELHPCCLFLSLLSQLFKTFLASIFLGYYLEEFIYYKW